MVRRKKPDSEQTKSILSLPLSDTDRERLKHHLNKDLTSTEQDRMRLTAEKLSTGKQTEGGKPYTYTIDEIKAALYVAKGIPTQAAKALGCEYAVMWAYLDRFKILKEYQEKVFDTNLDTAESKLLAMIDDKESGDHFKAVKFYLTTKGKKRGYVDNGEKEKVSPAPIRIVPAKKKVKETKQAVS